MSEKHSHYGRAGNGENWVLVEDDDDEEFRGVVIMVDPTLGKADSLTTRQCRDHQRWKQMPSLTRFQSLVTLDLSKCRYLTRLHPSIGELSALQQLNLTRCERLEGLPDSIGQLSNLQEVRCSVLCIVFGIISARNLTLPWSCVAGHDGLLRAVESPGFNGRSQEVQRLIVF